MGPTFLDSHLLLKRCPHCRVDNPNITDVKRFITNSFDNSNQRHWAIYVCNRCGGVITASSGDPNGVVDELYPRGISVSDYIPERARVFLDQAIDSLGAPSGSIMLAASSIDSMLKNKGYKERSLYSRIKKATDDHLITEGMSKWAHSVRIEANSERHADEISDLPDHQDAKKTVEFALALAEFLFVLPSRVEKGIEEANKEE